jgi:hypothetical protein
MDHSRLDVGFEYSELMQNKFRNLGKNNHTFLIGQQIGRNKTSVFGWRYMIINVELSTEHIQNPNQVAFIEGNRMDLTGKVHAQRATFDFNPFTLGIAYIEKWNRHILTVTPTIYSGLGYNIWEFTNTKYDDSYHLEALTFSLGVRLRSTIFDLVFIENPLIDVFAYVAKSRSVGGNIGDTEITRPEHFGVFSWATIGITIPLNI